MCLVVAGRSECFAGRYREQNSCVIGQCGENDGTAVQDGGKQSVKQLIGQNQGVSTIESNDPHIKDFDRVARKYGVDYAIKKVKDDDGKSKYVIFFKARDADALTQAFTEYTRKSAEREKKPSVRAKLRELAEKVKNKVLERTKTKQRGQEL